MNVTKETAELLELAFSIARENHFEYVTPEVLLFAFCHQSYFGEAFEACGGDLDALGDGLYDYLNQYLKVMEEVDPTLSAAAGQMCVIAAKNAENSGKKLVEPIHLLRALWKLEESDALYLIRLQGIEEVDLLEAMMDVKESREAIKGMSESGDAADYEGNGDDSESARRSIMAFAPCLNETLKDVNPLIGREDELERTIQILCRRDKNNPLHIGEPGVGKTAITYGLVEKLRKNQVPEALLGAKVYALDLGSLLAGTQYRGDFEKRLKKLLDAIAKEEKPIIYIDEIHNLAGAGAVGEGSWDASNMLKAYLAEGKIRFIGATTYEEYKKHFEKNKSLVRRFQNVDIPEPTVDETIAILQGLKKKYEKYHGVRYGKGVLEYAARMSQKYINERFLPDKAIDLMDEAGAFRRIHPLDQKSQTIGKDVIDEILTNICRVPVEAAKQEKDENLASLEKRILAQVYGQDEAVKQVVNAVKFSRAGLLEEGKPLSSLLFVGPTGVGKTEIAKTLAKELGVKLVRFDMSEYGEKHSIAKLIGSPAGYVGYEEGGLLTEAIRKNPSSVLLLDEIEKAHPDIFHVLLQVMDYATLTDNQGRKADFRNVIIIMTSNAGANRIGKPRLGFQSQDVSDEVLMEEVKKTFQPEFRNRLNRIVAFAGMDDKMAERIAAKKLRELASLLEAKKVKLTFTEEAVKLLHKKGISTEFGARELDRVIQNEIKTLLVDELLFGKLKKGGDVQVTGDAEENTFVLNIMKLAKK